MTFCGKANSKGRRGRPMGSSNSCFKKGLSAGFGAGIQKGKEEERKKGIKRAKIVKAIKGRHTKTSLRGKGKGELEAISRRAGISGGRHKTKEALVLEIMEKQRQRGN